MRKYNYIVYRYKYCNFHDYFPWLISEMNSINQRLEIIKNFHFHTYDKTGSTIYCLVSVIVDIRNFLELDIIFFDSNSFEFRNLILMLGIISIVQFPYLQVPTIVPDCLIHSPKFLIIIIIISFHFMLFLPIEFAPSVV